MRPLPVRSPTPMPWPDGSSRSTYSTNSPCHGLAVGQQLVDPLRAAGGVGHYLDHAVAVDVVTLDDFYAAGRGDRVDAPLGVPGTLGVLVPADAPCSTSPR